MKKFWGILTIFSLLFVFSAATFVAAEESANINEERQESTDDSLNTEPQTELLTYNESEVSEVNTSATSVNLTNCTNIAVGKTIYGANEASAINGDGTTLVDEDASTFTINNKWETWDVNDGLGAAFVIDLGDEYTKYNVKQIDIVTIAPDVWAGAEQYIKNWNAFMADDYLVYEGNYYTRAADNAEMTRIGAVKLGFIEDVSAALTTQTTYSITISVETTKRYIIISHELGVVPFLSLSEVKVWAETKRESELLPEVEIANFKFCNKRMKEITDLSDLSKEIGAMATAKNISSTDKNLCAIVALYNENNIITDMYVLSYVIVPGETVAPVITFDTEEEIKNGYSLKAFYWVSDTYMKPYIVHKTLVHNQDVLVEEN